MTIRLLIIPALLVSFTTAAPAQRRRKAAPKRRPAASKPKPVAKPPIIGTQVTVVTKTGERISGPIVDLTAQGLKLSGQDVETVVPFENVASLYFTTVPPAPENGADATGAEDKPRQHHVISTRDVQTVFSAFKAMEDLIKSGPDYTDYSRQLTELKRAADKFVGKYSTSEDPTEVRIAALVAGAADDYTWARTIWTLRLGRPADTSLALSDSPAVADAVQLYPDLAPAQGAKPTADKLISGLIHHAAEKIDTARKLIPPADK